MKRIYLSGTAKTGKDEFAKQAIKFFEKQGVRAKRFALADQLKLDIGEFVYDKFNIDIFNCTPEEKELVRPLMVAYGCAKRKISLGKYWVDFLENEISSYDGKIDIAIITDIRFCEYEDDEAIWATRTGKLIHLQRTDKYGDLILPANEEEERNDPKVRALASQYGMTILIPTMEPWEIEYHVGKILEESPELWK